MYAAMTILPQLVSYWFSFDHRHDLDVIVGNTAAQHNDGYGVDLGIHDNGDELWDTLGYADDKIMCVHSPGSCINAL